MSSGITKCCVSGFLHEGETRGTIEEFAGVRCYLTGDKTSKNVLLLLTDIFGIELNNSKLLADSFAARGYYVVTPDLFNADPLPINFKTLPDQSIVEAWWPNHSREITQPIIDTVLKGIRTELKPEFVGGLGYCFGGPYVVRLLEGKQIDAGSMVHPGGPFEVDAELRKIEAPLLIIAAETDSSFPLESRAVAEKALQAIGATYYINLFSGVTHGFAIRGDPANAAVKIAKEKALEDQVWFFKLYHN